LSAVGLALPDDDRAASRRHNHAVPAAWHSDGPRHIHAVHFRGGDQALNLIFALGGVGACPCRDVSKARQGRKKQLIAPCFGKDTALEHTPTRYSAFSKFNDNKRLRISSSVIASV